MDNGHSYLNPGIEYVKYCATEVFHCPIKMKEMVSAMQPNLQPCWKKLLCEDNSSLQMTLKLFTSDIDRISFVLWKLSPGRTSSLSILFLGRVIRKNRWTKHRSTTKKVPLASRRPFCPEARMMKKRRCQSWIGLLSQHTNNDNDQRGFLDLQYYGSYKF